MTNKKTMVTGGAGFVGTNLCEKLINNGHDVICVDNLYTGNMDNIKHLLPLPNFKFIEHDIIAPIFEKVDEIYNLACPASPPAYQKDAIHTLKTCTIGMINVLNLAKRVGAKVVQASTSEVYGDPQLHPQRETYWGNVNPIGERSCYDEGKRVAESLCINYKKQHNVDVKIARIFNTYGPYMDKDDGRVISNFITQSLQGKPLTIYGNGTQTRSFQYIDDLTNGLIKLMNTETGVGPFNIGNPEEYSIKCLAEKVSEKLNNVLCVEESTLPPDDPLQRCPDITKMRIICEWEPKIKLDEGLDKTIEYFKRVLNQEQ